jgi:6-phosphogluconate dehydrogenase
MLENERREEESAMQIGVIGLGRMGANIARRLMRHGHTCVVCDRDPEPRRALAKAGASIAPNLTELVRNLVAPRVVWIMLPAGAATEAAIDELSHQLQRGDTIIDGGNTFWKESAAPASSRPMTSTTSTSAPRAACGDWSAATA